MHSCYYTICNPQRKYHNQPLLMPTHIRFKLGITLLAILHNLLVQVQIAVAYAPPLPPAWAADPQCKTGIQKSGVCCPSSCGVLCGVKGCGSAPGGSSTCCSSAIRGSGHSCNTNMPPCIMNDGPQCTLSDGVEYIGNNIRVFDSVDGLTKCCSLCSQNQSCAYFTYDKNLSKCYLKSENAPDTSRPSKTCTSGFTGVDPPAPLPPSLVSMQVELGHPLAKTSDAFVCWNIDASANRQFFTRNISTHGSNMGSRMAKQARALGSAQALGYSILRFGGSGNDYLTYGGFGKTECPPVSTYKQCMNVTLWGNLLDFTRSANAKMICGLSLNTGHDRRRLQGDDDPFPQVWDPTNARELLQWTIAHGAGDLIHGFELGNEQNTQYSGQTIAKNLAVLHNLTIELWPDAAERPKLYGPDPHSFKQNGPESSILDWMAAFMDEAKALKLPVAGITHHEYIEIDTTSVLKPSKLNVTADIASAVSNIVSAHMPSAKPWAGEVGPHNGGSPPCDHTSMRWANFADSLWYADAMAIKAMYGYGGFCRQDFIGADYGMLDCSSGAPLPDYWTALIWARSMGSTALQTNITTAKSSAVRAYAHCSNSMSKEGPSDVKRGDITILLINLASESVGVQLPTGLSSLDREEFHLTGSEAGSSLSNATGLQGTSILLNGELLDLRSDGSVPSTRGIEKSGTNIKMSPHSLAFVVVHKANAKACLL